MWNPSWRCAITNIWNGYIWHPHLFGNRITVHQLIGYSPYFMGTQCGAVLPLTLQKQLTFSPLSMFPLQPRISLHTMPNSSRKDQRIFVRCQLGSWRPESNQLASLSAFFVDHPGIWLLSRIAHPCAQFHIEKELNCKTKSCFLVHWGCP